MRKEDTQKKWVIEQLKNRGEIYRNAALSLRISRVASIICKMNKEGWHIEGAHYKTPHGRDYRYTLISPPMKKQVQVVEKDGLFFKQEVAVPLF